MRTTLIGLGALVAAMAFACSARAAYLGLQVVRVGTMNTVSGLKTVYRVYATFSQGNDRVLFWGGMSGNPTVIRTTNCNLQNGSPFYQHPLGGNTSPTQELVTKSPDAAWDTFATMGVSIANQGSGPPPGGPDQTLLSPGFPTFINGNQVTINNAAVAAPSDAAQARADYAGDGDPQLRVLLMQLTVEPNNGIGGVLGALGIQPGGTVTNQQIIYVFEPQGTCCLPTGGCMYTDSVVCGMSGGEFICGLCGDCPPPCVADIVDNGAVDVNDLLAVIGHWGPCPPLTCHQNCDADIAPIAVPLGNCVVNVDDLLGVITTWGPCP